MASKEKAADILELAIEYVKNGWTKYSVARDGDGYPVPCIHGSASFFCLEGAITRASWEKQDWVNDLVAIKIIEDMEECRIDTLNDELVKSVEEAVRILERGIETLRKPTTAKKGRKDRKAKRPGIAGARDKDAQEPSLKRVRRRKRRPDATLRK